MKKIVWIAAALLLGACGNKGGKPSQNDTVGMTADLPSLRGEQRFRSDLRPGEEIRIDSLYRDTVTYLEYDGNGDVWALFVEKNGKQVRLATDMEGGAGMRRGDRVAVEWSMTRIDVAGEADSTCVGEWAHSLAPVKKGPLSLWYRDYSRRVSFAWEYRGEPDEEYQAWSREAVECFLASVYFFHKPDDKALWNFLNEKGVCTVRIRPGDGDYDPEQELPPAEVEVTGDKGVIYSLSVEFEGRRYVYRLFDDVQKSFYEAEL